MRHIPYTLLVLAATAGFASAQATAYTIPVGYVTETLAPDQYNMIGLTMHASPVAQGVLDADDADSVTDTQVDFGALLTAGKTYILEITSGAGLGVVQQITAWTGSDLTTPDDLSAVVDATTTYTLRVARTVDDVFGAANSAGLTPTDELNPDEADLILVPKPDGTFTSVYFSDVPGFPEFTGWLDTDNMSAGTLPIVYTDALFVQRRPGTSIDLVVNGEVKKTATRVSPVNTFTYVGGVYPVGSTLANSGLASSVTPSDELNPDEADLVLLAKPDGTYLSCYYSDVPGFPEFTGWLDTDNGDANDNPITSGYIVQLRGPSFDATITPPPGYSSL